MIEKKRENGIFKDSLGNMVLNLYVKITKEVKFGQSLYLVGSVPALGNWNP